MALTILAQITAHAGKEELVRTELLKLVAITRTEEGCLQYDLHADNTDPAFFVFFERWTSRELWQTHMAASHIAAFAAATDGAVADFNLHEMSLIA